MRAGECPVLVRKGFQWERHIPNTDTEFLAWAKNFSTYLAAHTAELGIAPPAAAPITTGVTEFETDFVGHTTAQQSARSACQLKDQSRESIENAIRGIVRQIQASPIVTDAQREALGITVRGERVFTQMAGDLSRPQGKVDTSKRMCHTVHYRDESAAGKARPAWAIGCEVWRAIREANVPTPLEPAEYLNLGLNSASPMMIEYQGSDVGKMAHYMLRWIGRDGTKSTFSEIVSATIVG